VTIPHHHHHQTMILESHLDDEEELPLRRPKWTLTRARTIVLHTDDHSLSEQGVRVRAMLPITLGIHRIVISRNIDIVILEVTMTQIVEIDDLVTTGLVSVIALITVLQNMIQMVHASRNTCGKSITSIIVS
jgi:hypothetical protein